MASQQGRFCVSCGVTLCPYPPRVRKRAEATDAPAAYHGTRRGYGGNLSTSLHRYASTHFWHKHRDSLRSSLPSQPLHHPLPHNRLARLWNRNLSECPRIDARLSSAPTLPETLSVRHGASAGPVLGRAREKFRATARQVHRTLTRIADDSCQSEKIPTGA